MTTRHVLLAALAAATLTADASAQCPGGYSGGSPVTVSRSPQVHGRLAGSPGAPGAAAPSTPGPSQPSTPAPGTPSTPRSGGPSTGGGKLPTPGAAGPTTLGPRLPGRGAPMEFRRGKTSSERLQIEWDYPIPPDADAQALSRTRALEVVRGDDPRPLLVLRECATCRGTDRALLDAAQNDERTVLMTRWFHCVKLPNHVWDPGHPLHALFDGTGGGHLFLASRDGETVIPFPGVQPRSALWRAMYSILDDEYQKDAKRTVGRLVRHLDVYDRIDAKIADALEQSDRALEYHGPDSSKYGRAHRRLEKERADLARALEAEERIADLGLRREPIEKD